MAKTKAQENRAIRQEALRTQLAEQCRVQHIIDNIKKINELSGVNIKDYNDATEYIAALSTAKDKASIIKMAVDCQFKLLSKYLPDLKQQELVGEGGGPIETSVPVMFVDAEED